MSETPSEPLIVAVSGGVDSMVMLDMLAKQGRNIVVAHVNHGMRPDSDSDEQFVSARAREYGLPFASVRLHLKQSASEDFARQKRYAWLRLMQTKYGARLLATAHHQDDVLETIMVNLLRGTGWRGLCSLRSTDTLLRPLLGLSKAEIVAYAIGHDISWQEDATNETYKYLRNRIRHSIVPRLSSGKRKRLLELYDAQLALRQSIETELDGIRSRIRERDAIKRYPLIMTDESVGIELLRSWLAMPLERPRLHDLLLFSKVARVGAKWSIDERRFVEAGKDRLIVLPSRD